MHVLGGFVLAAAAVHLVVAVFHLVLWRRAPGYGFGTFAAVSISLAVYNIGGVGMLEAASRHQAAHYQQVRMVGAALLALSFTRLLHDVAGLPRGHTWRLSHVLALLYGVAGVSMAGIDPGRPAWPPGATMAFGLQPDFGYYLRGGVLVAAAHGGVAFTAMLAVARRRFDTFEGRVLVLSGTPALLAWTHDMALHLVAFRSFFLLEHASIVTSVGIAVLMQRRFVEATEELRRRTLELRGLQEELRAMQDELLRTEQLAALGELAAIVAESLRRPIRRLVQDVQKLRGLAWHDDEAARPPLLQRMNDAIRELDRLVKDLVAYARPVEPQYRPVDLDAVLSAALEEVAAEIGWEPAVRISGPSDLSVHGDPRLLQRAVRSMFLHVLHEATAQPLLEIRLRRESAPDPEQSAHVGIEVRTRAGRRGESGAPAPALRLVVVERLVEAHGGAVRRRRGDGVTWVDVTLPVDRRDSKLPGP